jgi:DNA-binding SARP family transcriptional activator
VFVIDGAAKGSQAAGKEGLPRVRVLGPIAVRTNGEWIEIRGRQTRTILAALVVSARHVIPSDLLIDAVWGAGAPDGAVAALQTHISRLRHILGAGTIQHEANGYALEIPCARIDACRFERLAIDAERLCATDPEAGYRRALAALRMWRGMPFGDLDDVEFLRLEVRRLEEIRIGVQQTALAAELDTGRVTEAVAALSTDVLEYPYREGLWYLLARGLALQGRRVEALEALDRYREIVAAAALEPDDRIDRLAETIRSGVHPPMSTGANPDG